MALCAICGGCGGDGGGSTSAQRTGTATTPGGAAPQVTAADAAVIRRWADTLRGGDVSGAAAFFGLPVAVANGTRPLRLDTRAEVVAFNRSLPCGAELLDTEPGEQGLIVATFRLTERDGPGGGACDGTGNRAQAAFLIEDGLITHWLRVQDLPAPDATPS